MGNRAVITIAHRDMSGNIIKRVKDTDIGVYLHWNGGYDSVNAFLTYCDIKGYRPPESDCYGWARLCQVIGNFFGGTDSLGIDINKKVNSITKEERQKLVELFKNFRDKYMRSALEKMDFPEFPPDVEKRYQIIFSGIVQGVGFRYEAWLIAQKLGLTGFAENLPNGDVRMEIQGPENKIFHLILCM